MNQGWIKLHLDSALMKKGAYLQIWVTLLLKANHERTEFIFNNKKQVLMPGQLITGRKKLSKITKVNQYKVERILKYLESAQQIAQRTTSKFRIITILNWQKYQAGAQQSEHQMHNNCTSSAQPAHTYKNDKNEKNEKNYRGGSSQDDFQSRQFAKWLQELKEEGDF